MKTAYRLYSWRGIVKELVEAKEIKSPADARKLAPFVDTDKYPFLWVNWSKPKANTGKKTAPYFRRYPTARIRSQKKPIRINDELEERKKYSEGDLHKKARMALTSYLNEQIEEGKELRWAYLDKRVSDFPLIGNLLSEVETATTHYSYTTPFGLNYEFDIALLGRKIGSGKMLLGAIEIEHTHNFGFLKLLVSKCLGFPLISVNIEGLTLDDIDENWCRRVISETCNNSSDGLRKNYIYLHNSLYPVFTSIPSKLRSDGKHQYVIFCKEKDFDELFNILKRYRDLLQLSASEVLMQPVRINYNDESSIKTAKNEGSMAGSDWRDFNDKRYLRITLPAPVKKRGHNYLFHLVLARLLNAHFDTLVGYKYRKSLYNRDADSPIWYDDFGNNKVMQKHLSEPVRYLVEHLKECGLIDAVIKVN